MVTKGNSMKEVISRVLVDDYDENYCAACGQTIACDEFGDMPEYCPNCKLLLDYSLYNAAREQGIQS